MTEQEDLKMWAEIWLTFDQKWPNHQIGRFIADKPKSYQDEFRRRWLAMRHNRNNGYKGEIKA